MSENDEKLNEIADALPANGAGSEEAVAQVTAADAAADAQEPAPTEQPAQELPKLPAPRCPFCQIALFSASRFGVTPYNIQMGPERIRIFTCSNCDSVLPVQVMMVDTPMIAQPGPQGGRLVRMYS